jgi:hypothetical protein
MLKPAKETPARRTAANSHSTKVLKSFFVASKPSTVIFVNLTPSISNPLKKTAAMRAFVLCPSENFHPQLLLSASFERHFGS